MPHPSRFPSGDRNMALLPDRSGRSEQTRGPAFPLQQLFPGDGEMARLMRAFDWSRTSLGPVETWPQSLKASLQLMLCSRFPMFVWWGRDLIKFYNDAYIPVLGKRHPGALGQSARTVWREIWDTLGPQTEIVLNTKNATWNERVLLVMERNGYLEETYFTFSYSPVMREDGMVGGVFCACMEETDRVLGERRLNTLRQLATATADCRTVQAACTALARVLDKHRRDVPFALLYVIQPDGGRAKLVAHSGDIPPGEVVPEGVECSGDDSIAARLWRWPQALQGDVVTVDDLDRQVDFPSGPWPESTKTAVVRPLRKGDGQPIGFVVLGTSPRRALDDAYKGFLDLVAVSIVTAIANAGASEQERQRAEALAELDRAKTAFFSNVSHEFRTPLSLILGPLEDLLSQGGRLPHWATEALAITHRNSLRLLRLVNALLDFSRIEAGRTEAVYEPTDLAAVTADLASVFRSAIEKAGLRFIVHCPPLPEPVYVDRDMWEKIVLNLLSNAFKYTFEGQIAVTLEAKADAVELRVSDTGTGIPAEELPRMFDRFHRIQGARSRTHEGTGIGLALVQELVKLHGGAIRVESDYGKGSLFIVTLAFGTAHLPKDRIGGERHLQSTATDAGAYVQEALRWLPDEPAPHKALAHLTVAEPIPPAWREPEQGAARPHILVADDNADMREYIRRLLSQTYEVQAVADGVAALEAVRRRVPDLILSDIMMPNLDGLGLLQELRRQPETQSIPVIVLSARAGEEARVDGLSAGADDYLTKPFSARELLARVRRHLEMVRIRRESEAVVRESEVRFRELADHAPLLIWVADERGHAEFVNRTYRTFFNIESSQAAGQKWEDLIHPDDREAYVKEFLAALAAGCCFRGECRVRRADGQWRWLDSHAVPRAAASGGKFGMVGCSLDITERKEAESRVQALRQELQLIFDSAPAMIWQKDTQNRILRINQVAADLIGLPKEAIEGRHTADLYPDEAERYYRDDLIVIQSGKPRLGIVEPLLAASGERRWIQTDKVPLVDGAGQVTGILVFAIDITERKRVEAELAAEKRRMELVLESAGEGIFGLDAEGRCTFINPAGAAMFGYEVGHLFERNTHAILHHSHSDGRSYPLRECPVYATLADGQVHRGEEEVFWHKDGRPIPVSYTSTPVWDGDRLSGAVVVVRDITDRKRAEEEIERLLEQEQAAREEAEHANRLKDEFLATVSHELRTPLNAIFGWSQVLLSHKPDEATASRAIRTIESNARAQIQLTNDLMDVSRIITGKLRLEIKRFVLAAVVEAAMEAIVPAVNGKRLTLDARVDPRAIEMDGDPERLQQVIWNLLSNAVKFTPPGGRIMVTLGHEQDAATLVVSDTGQGIAPSFLPHVFDRLRQFDGSSTREHTGLGLGLSIVRHIVEMHGGTVSAESPGLERGATFTVRLPLNVSVGVAQTGVPMAQEEQAEQPQAVSLKGVSVLFVDDDETALEIVSRILVGAGAEVRTAGTAKEAYDIVRRARPDVILSDLAMPGTDGYSFLRQVRALVPEEGGQIPAAALTAYTRVEDRLKALRAGYQNHIPKPVDARELIIVVAALAHKF